MKKLLTCLKLLALLFVTSFSLQAQTGSLQATATGSDLTNPAATVIVGDITNNQPATSLLLTTNNTVGNCGAGTNEWYFYHIIIDGVYEMEEVCNVTDLDLSTLVSDVGDVILVSVEGADDPSDGVTDNITVDMTLTATWLGVGTDILTYGLLDDGSEVAPAVIDDVNHTITLDVANSYDETTSVNVFTLSPGATASIAGVDQESGVTANDFTSPVTYTVTAADGGTQDWVVTMNVAATASTEKDMLSFNIAGFDGVIGANTIDLDITDPFLGLDLTALVPTFESSDFSSVTIAAVDQESGVTSNDFTSTVIYTVTAEDGTTKDYITTVTLATVCGSTIVFDSSASTTETSQTWSIVPPLGETVTLDFTVWSIDAGGWSDQVNIFDGDSNASPQISNNIGGEPNPGSISSTASNGALTIEFLVGSAANNNTQFTAGITCAPASSENDFISFSIPEELDFATIDTDAHTINIEATFGTDPSLLTPSFESSIGSTVDIGGVVQVSGAEDINFTGPVTYTVTAQDGTTQDWTVTISVAASASDANDILTFSIDGIDAAIGVAIAANVDAFTTDLTALTPEFTISPFATIAIAGIDQVSGVTANDYTADVTYTVTAQDGSTQDWVVTVTIPSMCGETLVYDADILGDGVDQTFFFTPDPGMAITLDFTAWGPDFNSWGNIVSIYDGPDTSSPLIGSYDDASDPNPGPITSTATGGEITIDVELFTTIQSQTFFTADVTCNPLSSESDFLTFTLPEQLSDAIIDTDAHTIDLETAFGTDVTALTPSFTSSIASTVDIGGTDQESGVTTNNYTGPVTYTITAQDGTTQDWTISISVSTTASPDNDFTLFNINGVDGTIGAGTVDVEIPAFDPFVDALVPTFTSSPFSTVAIAGVDQVSGVDVVDFTSPVTYTITAQDGSTQDWVVTVTIADPCGQTIVFDGTVNDEDDETWVIIPPAGQTIQLDFTTWTIDPGGWGDIWNMYNGDSNGAPLISSNIGGEANPGTITSTAINGAITVEFLVGFSPNNGATEVTADITCVPGSSENDILTYSIPEESAPAVIDSDAHTIDIEVGFSTDLTALISSFTISESATINIAGVDQVSGTTANDFTTVVTYDVVAQDLTVQQWTVTIVNAATASTDKDILTYSVAGIDATIGTNTVDLDITDPFLGLDITNIIANFTTSPFSTASVSGVDQESDVTGNDFTATVTYTVTAEDGTTKDYLVNITVASVCGQTLAYDADILGDGVDETFTFIPPAGELITIDFTAWGPDFNSWGNIVSIYDGADTSSPLIGSYNDPSNPNPGPIQSTSIDGAITIDVELFGTTQSQTFFTVDITCDLPSSENDFLSFTLPEGTGIGDIDTDAHTVEIEVTLGTDPSALIPSFTISDFATIDIADTDQVSGVTENTYTGPVTYTITAQDGTEQDWIVTVSVAAALSSEADIITFSIDGIDGVVGDGTVDLEINPFSPDLTALTPDFTISPFATVAVEGVDQVSGTTTNDYTSSITYTVTAQDGTETHWVVNVTVGDICGASLDYPLGDVNYVNNENEEWTIVPNPGELVTISFNSFGTEGCCDHLFVYEGTDDTGTFLFELDGTGLPADISSSIGFYLNFTSDVSVVNEGFDLTVSCSNFENDIITLSHDEQTGPAVIDDVNHTIDLEVGFGVDVTTLAPDFTISPFATVNVAGLDQTSGSSPNDFTTPVTYTVVGFDGVEQDWIVNIFENPTPSTANDIITFSINGVDGTIGTGTVDLVMGAFDNLSELTPDFTISPFADVTVGGAPQISGFFTHDFTSPVTYVVTAEDGSTQDWVVTVTQPSVCGETLTYDADILGDGVDQTFVLTPDAGTVITIDFTAWGPDFNSWGNVVSIYDGPSTSSPLIGSYDDASDPNPGPITSTATGGEITIDVELFGTTQSQTFFTADITCNSVDATLDLTVLLEGPFDGGTGLMGTGLRDGSYIPLTDPYEGGSTLAATFFDVGNNLTVVDWVEIEIRQAATAAEADELTIMERFNGLLLSDGSVVGLDGTTDMFLTGVTGDVFIVVNHRNHLSVMSSVAVSPVDGVYTYDFTSSVTQAYLSGCSDVGGTAVMTTGDVNGDGTVKYVGADNDSTIIFNLIDGNTNLNNTEAGYYGSDLNMDGIAKYVGADNDDIMIFNKIDGNVNLNNTVPTTLP